LSEHLVQIKRENMDNIQESVQEKVTDVQENVTEEPEKTSEEPENVQESMPEDYDKQPENVQENLPRKGRPRKSEEEKRETRHQKYLRAKERRQVRVVEPDEPFVEPEQTPEQIPQPEIQQISAVELLQRALRESKEQERLRKEALYDSWFQRLKRNNACYQR
jgi:hypothetical protein